MGGGKGPRTGGCLSGCQIQWGLEENGVLPIKTKRFPDDIPKEQMLLLVSSGFLLLPFLRNQRKSFLEYASLWNPEVYGRPQTHWQV